MSEPVRRVMLVGNGEFYHVGAFFHRALGELGYQAGFVDESRHFRTHERSLLKRAAFRLRGRRLRARRLFNRTLLEAAHSFRPNLVLVVKGSYVEPEVLAEVKAETRARLVNYATDDPFNPATSTSQVVAAIPLYDLYCTTKRAIIPDIARHGCRRVAYVRFGYDPTLHFPERPTSRDEEHRWTSDVMFAGGCDGDRAPFFAALARLPQLDMHLYGGYWNRYGGMRRFWRGFAHGRDYRMALGCTRSAPCLVRQSNRDGHVMRTFEIPACGSFMIAERTEEHLELFEEGREMACFGSAEELVDKVLHYLSHEEERRRIAAAGYRKVTGGGHTYRDRLIEILRAAGSS